MPTWPCANTWSPNSFPVPKFIILNKSQFLKPPPTNNHPKPSPNFWSPFLSVTFYNWTASYGSVLFVGSIVCATILLVFAVRATFVTWITVLVLLACMGNRRKVLVRRGRKITTDVAVYSVKVVVRERRLVAMACATVLSLIAMIQIKETF
ncbi:hypothetical protein ACFE04_005740 [Oxalis oulophora]